MFILNRGASKKFDELNKFNSAYSGKFQDGGDVQFASGSSSGSVISGSTADFSGNVQTKQVIQLVVSGQVLADVLNTVNNNNTSSGLDISENT